ncbi:protein unc-50 homolog isoform X1 [Megalops cyprinoides]|uniref:protein unc-50 homolog isoform X1 n=1 Tax=Megalops cyprinoides TaxID=118141 RepID=UPI001864F477|nr:protein unc-50 homolog isoform X1 [Megalops cyprinoides]XP_036396051.1 protein unc-50 homolog isoform X1 [Megalops cyprinoides]
MLPTTSYSPLSQDNGVLGTRDAARHSAGAKRYKYLRRLVRFRQMDFEFAAWQMLYLFTSPQRVYRNFHYRKQTKDQWARDDPAFLVLLSIWLCVSTVGFGFVLDMGLVETLKLLLWVVFIDCIGVGLLISTLMWVVTNKYLMKHQSKDYDVEWGYAFDVHLNAFYPLLVILHFLQLFFINHIVVINSDWFLGYFVGNTLWLTAIGYYIYITFLGYSGEWQPGERGQPLQRHGPLIRSAAPCFVPLFMPRSRGTCIAYKPPLNSVCNPVQHDGVLELKHFAQEFNTEVPFGI